MKKLILLSLITIGIGAAGATAQAGGLSFGITVNGPRLPFFLPPLPLILAPPVVVVGGCAQPVVVRDCGPDFRYRGDVRRYGYDHRFDDRRDARYYGGGFNHR
jgi:hypothetical protein